MPHRVLRKAFPALYDMIVALLCVPLSYALRIDFDYLTRYTDYMLIGSGLYLMSLFVFMVVFRVNTRVWKYTSIPDILSLSGAIFFSVSLWYPLASYFKKNPYTLHPRSVYFIVLGLSLAFLCGARVLARLYYEFYGQGGGSQQRSKKLAYLVGDISVIDKTIVFLRKSFNVHYVPIGIILTEPRYLGKAIRNVPVVGSLENLPGVFKNTLSEKAELAIFIDSKPKYSYEPEVFQSFMAQGIPTLFLPTLSSITLKDNKNHTVVERIDYDLLLRRTNYVMDPERKSRLLSQKTILITGGGGSIGSEIVRQIALLNPKEIVILDNSEYLLYLIEMELSRKLPNVKKTALLGDVRDLNKLRHVFDKYRPSIVFHAAAIKHVPMAEENPDYAFEVNVLGTQNVIQASIAAKVDLMVLISTDKAVNPTSIMGATKQMAEMLCAAQAPTGENSTQFLSVRFGNVIGSNGSVLPLFEKQIDEGGPITITHKEMVRFFMTISEAVELVLESASISLARELAIEQGIFVLNMGEPIKIADLAQQLLLMKGAHLKHIPIHYTGLRPGEKLYEELFNDTETVLDTQHDWLKIAVAKQQKSEVELKEALQTLRLAVEANDLEAIKGLIKKTVYNFQEGPGV